MRRNPKIELSVDASCETEASHVGRRSEKGDGRAKPYSGEPRCRRLACITAPNASPPSICSNATNRQRGTWAWTRRGGCAASKASRRGGGGMDLECSEMGPTASMSLARQPKCILQQVNASPGAPCPTLRTSKCVGSETTGQRDAMGGKDGAKRQWQEKKGQRLCRVRAIAAGAHASPSLTREKGGTPHSKIFFRSIAHHFARSECAAGDTFPPDLS